MQADLPSPGSEQASSRSVRSRGIGAIHGLAGPALIVGSVLVVLRHYAFFPKVSSEDVVRYWLPMFDFLGSSLRAGHIPAWNPFVLGGTPFAADPQSGWMQVLPMVLFTTLPVGAAIRWLVVLQPMLAGLGLYAFLRGEETSRTSATVGGLALALVISGSRLPVSIRFPGALAWTAVSLAACSRYLRADRLSRRILWGLGTAAAWGQVAASHLTVGLLIGTGALLAYVLAKALSNRRARAGTARSVLAPGGLLALFLPAVNLAYLLPRLAFAPQTSLALGYGRLQELSLRYTGVASPAFPGLAAGPKWPLDLSTFPGRYLGAAPLLLMFSAFWSRRYRHVAIAFAAYGACSYALGLRVVAYNIPASIQSSPLVDQYLHEPYWLSFGVLLAAGVLAGIGVEAWRERRSTPERALMAGLAVAVWLVLPIVAGAPAADLLLLVVAGAVTGTALILSVRRPKVLAILPILLVGEILITLSLGSSRLPFRGDLKLLADLDRPAVRVSAYLTSTPLSRVLAEERGARYYTLGRTTSRPYVEPRALQNNESMIHGLENLGGYQAVQLQRYWIFVRRLQRNPMRYNYAAFVDPPPSVSDILDIGWVISPASAAAPQALFPVADDGQWILYRRRGSPPRASVVTSWTVVPGDDAALESVARPGFDPAAEAILEEDPGIGPASGAPGRASPSYRRLGNQAARLDVITSAPAIVLVRNVWDRNWRVRVDGRPGKVIPTDYVAQGVPVGPGRHRIVLTYDDPSIAQGLLGSAIALGAMLGASLGAARHEGRRRT